VRVYPAYTRRVRAYIEQVVTNRPKRARTRPDGPRSEHSMPVLCTYADMGPTYMFYWVGVFAATRKPFGWSSAYASCIRARGYRRVVSADVSRTRTRETPRRGRWWVTTGSMSNLPVAYISSPHRRHQNE